MSAIRSVSIVISTYSSERLPTILKSIKSVLLQFFSSKLAVNHLELVVIVERNLRLLRCLIQGIDQVLKSLELLARAEDAATEMQVSGTQKTARIIVAFSKRKLGLSGARNVGVVLSRGDVLVFLDDDAVPLDGWFNFMLAPYIVDDEIAGVGGASIPVVGRRLVDLIIEQCCWLFGSHPKTLDDITRPVFGVIGSNMSFRRAIFEKCGLFSERLGYKCAAGQAIQIGGEETEFCARIHKLIPRAKIVFVPQAQVLHFVCLRRPTFRVILKKIVEFGLLRAVLSEVLRVYGDLIVKKYWRHHRDFLMSHLKTILTRLIGGQINATLGLIVTLFAGFATALITLGSKAWAKRLVMRLSMSRTSSTEIYSQRIQETSKVIIMYSRNIVLRVA